jgi:hypothetical protein
MNKHYEAQAHATLLKVFLVNLEHADQHRRNGVEVTLPMSQSVADVVFAGIRRALDGEDDPFRMKPPRGKGPKLSRAQWQFLAAVVARLIADGATREVAFERASELFSSELFVLSPQSARAAYYQEKQMVEGHMGYHWRDYAARVIAGEHFSNIVP